MPFPNQRKSLRKKSARAKKVYRKYTKKARGPVRNLTSSNLGQGFPKKLTMTHKYNDVGLTLTSIIGSLGRYQIKCNGMFDPNFTGTGHQPMYFDQMAALYDHFHVIGSKIKVTLVPTTPDVAYACGLMINDDITSPTTFAAIAENSSGKARYGTGQLQKPIVFSKAWSAKKTFGGSIMANDSLKGTPTADPTELSFFDIYVKSLDAATTSSFYLNVEVSYIAVWTELKDLNVS